MSDKTRKGRLLTHELPSKMVIEGGDNGEEVELPLEHQAGVPVYTKKVKLQYEKFFGLKRKKE